MEYVFNQNIVKKTRKNAISSEIVLSREFQDTCGMYTTHPLVHDFHLFLPTSHDFRSQLLFIGLFSLLMDSGQYFSLYIAMLKN